MVYPTGFPEGLSVKHEREVKYDSGFWPKQTGSMCCCSWEEGLGKSVTHFGMF